MRRRAFLSACAWGALTLIVRPAGAMPPPFAMVRKRLAKRASAKKKQPVTITQMARTIQSWRGVEKTTPFTLKHDEHGVLKLDIEAASPDSPGVRLLAAVMSDDPVEALESTFEGVRHSRAFIEAPRGQLLAYRYGTIPSILVERESWKLLEVDVGKFDGHHWKAILSYRPEAEHAHLIRITRDGRPALTARMG